MEAAGSEHESRQSQKSHGTDYSGKDAWLDAHSDPVASLYTFSSCVSLEDLDGDGDYKLLIGDLGCSESDAKLKIYKGINLMHTIQLSEFPSSVCTFMMDVNEPAVAVSNGSNVLIYKTIRPYFKFTLPLLKVNAKESELWQLMKEDKIEPMNLLTSLKTLSADPGDHPLTARSLTYIHLEPEDLVPFVSVFKQVPLKRQTVVTCMTILNKTHSDQGTASCLVVGTENKSLYILDPAAFTYLSRVNLPGVPVFLSAIGIFDVDYTISVACRDSFIYSVRKDSNSLQKILLPAPASGLVRAEKMIIVGTMNEALSCYTQKGKCLWSVKVPDCITTMETFHHKLRNFKAVLVALGNKEVRIYKDRYMVNKIVLNDIIVAMRFGHFGREENSLILIGESGSLSVKILKRGAVFDPKEANPGAPLSQSTKLNIPKKTKVFVDYAMRERENAIEIHQKFQRDLVQLKLDTSRRYLEALQSSSLPMTNAKLTSVNVSAQVQGVGPNFKLILSIQNTSPDASLINYYILIWGDSELYKITNKIIKLPLLAPAVTYTFSTLIECLNDYGQTDIIKAFLYSKGNSTPLLTAVIDMPISESFVV